MSVKRSMEKAQRKGKTDLLQHRRRGSSSSIAVSKEEESVARHLEVFVALGTLLELSKVALSIVPSGAKRVRKSA
jgi:hypothetical protein